MSTSQSDNRVLVTYSLDHAGIRNWPADADTIEENWLGFARARMSGDAVSKSVVIFVEVIILHGARALLTLTVTCVLAKALTIDLNGSEVIGTMTLGRDTGICHVNLDTVDTQIIRTMSGDRVNSMWRESVGGTSLEIVVIGRESRWSSSSRHSWFRNRDTDGPNTGVEITCRSVIQRSGNPETGNCQSQSLRRRGHGADAFASLRIDLWDKRGCARLADCIGEELFGIG